MNTQEEQQIDTIKNWLGAGSINVFGRPFSGKDTQGKRMAKLFDAPLIGGGDILRASKIPSDVKQIMSLGQLIPTADYVNIVLPFLEQKNLSKRPLVLSSIGRWHGEEAGVIQALEKSKHPLKVVIYLDIDESDVNKRWEAAKKLGDRGRRADDAHGALQVRLKEFSNKTLHVIEYYRKKGLLISIDGTMSEDEVTDEIIAQLYKKSYKN